MSDERSLDAYLQSVAVCFQAYLVRHQEKDEFETKGKIWLRGYLQKAWTSTLQQPHPLHLCALSPLYYAGTALVKLLSLVFLVLP